MIVSYIQYLDIDEYVFAVQCLRYLLKIMYAYFDS